MNRTTRYALAACTLWALLPLVAHSRTASTPAPQNHNSSHSPASRRPAAQEPASDGERVFNQNCARCHNAPQSFPPSITFAVVRHMRVRASLSAESEKALLQFMNP